MGKTKLVLKKNRQSNKVKGLRKDTKLPKFARANIVDRHNDVFDEAVKEGEQLIEILNKRSDK
ncbi:hypothetical protein [Sporosalibacterium faouarense]|uniref:hypothetical protein n=1 Tax=Sporosalibacterium faouarense TaxID=516123 RepID=UPI00141C5564|nr:hypothetical protein [Sporosalibacterium faouarense]MTI48907.1 hypothetical protein [Bacillota bacterium]